MKDMKFFVVLSNRFGGFGPAAFAAANGLKLGRHGDFIGWLDKEQLDSLSESGFTYKVLY